MTTILLALLSAVVLVQGCFPRIEDDPASNLIPKLRNQTGPPSTRSPLASGGCPQEAPDSLAWHVFVGVIVPDRAPSGPFTFSLCRGPHCIQAGGGAMYGSGPAVSASPVSSLSHHVVDHDVTALVKEQGWCWGGLRAELASSPVKGLPVPLLMRNTDPGNNQGGEVLVAGPRQMYGDLLDKYNTITQIQEENLGNRGFA